MKPFLTLALLCLHFLTSFAQKATSCLIKTSLGDIRIEVYPDKAPITVTNFLNYVDHQLYDGTNFFRVCTLKNEQERKVKIEVIQGGEVPETKQFKSIKLETTKQSGLKHQDGTLSMARDLPNSATSSFFICIGNQTELDYAGKRNPDGLGFAAFGKVTNGMKVVHKILSQKDKDQYLINPIMIYSIRRLD